MSLPSRIIPLPYIRKTFEVVEKDLKKLKRFRRIINPIAGNEDFYPFLHQFETTKKYGVGYEEKTPKYVKNSLVIGMPPISNLGYHMQKQYILASAKHSDFIVFILPGSWFKQDTFEEVELVKSYLFPPIKRDRGNTLKFCLNIYKRRRKEYKVKELQDCEVYTFHYDRKPNQKEEWLKVECDYRLISFGSVKLIDPKDPYVRSGEMKIVLKNKEINIEPVLQGLIANTKRTATSVRQSITKQRLIDFLYDNIPRLRAN